MKSEWLYDMLQDQGTVDFATFVYEGTGKMPWFEKKGLCD